MAVLENLRLALQSLQANPLRSVLTLVGIAVGIAAVLYVVVLGEITQERVQQRLESLGSNILLIRPGFSRMHGVRSGENVVNLTWDDAREIAQASEVVTQTVPTYTGPAVVEYRDQSWTTRATGATPAYASVNNDAPIAGRFFTAEELDQRARVCVLGATVNEKLFGEQSPIGQEVLIKSHRYKVIGLLGAKGESWWNPDDQVFLPLSTAQERLFGVDYLSTILAQMRSAGDYDEALFDIETILRRNHRLRPEQDNDFRVRRQDLFLATVQETTREIARLVLLIALVSLLVGGIGIANVMLVSVTERIREIGIRRAVGAKKGHVLMQFLMESVILGLLGGALGIAGGAAVNHFSIGGGHLLPWRWILYSFLVCAGIGVAAGLYPALGAANKDVVEALRYE